MMFRMNHLRIQSSEQILIPSLLQPGEEHQVFQGSKLNRGVLMGVGATLSTLQTNEPSASLGAENFLSLRGVADEATNK
jgi:hypothetical protein